MDDRDDRHLKSVTEVPSEPREQTKLQDEPRNMLTDSPIPVESNVPSIHSAAVSKTYSLAEEDLDEFQRLGNLFEPVRDLCSAALYSFLKRLSQQALTSSLGINVFDTMRAQEDMHDIFAISHV